MEKELRELLDKASDAIDQFEHKVESLTDELSDDAASLWSDMRTNLDTIKDKLKKSSHDLEDKADEASLQAHLGAMEASDRLTAIKETVEEFTQKVSGRAQTELDTVALRAHLARLEAEDFWESRGKDLVNEFNESGDKVKKLTHEATREIKSFLDKVANEFNKSV